jgi:iron complex outermembrane receptor protein
MEEIVVTAQKREQSVQDVPLSITAISGDTMRNLGYSNSTDVARMTPNLNIQSITGEGNQPAFFIRGIGLNDYNTNNAGPVGIYQDEVVISSPSAQAFALFDLERIEVLRGPQGTLYGRNTTAGAINFVSRKPTEETSFDFALRAGNFNALRLEAAASGPLSDTVRARVAVQSNKADGYIEDDVSGTQYAETDNQAIRLLLVFTPTDTLSLLLNVHYGKSDTISPVYKHRGAFDANTFDPATGLFLGFCSDAEIVSHEPHCVSALGYQDTNTDPRRGQYNRNGDLDFEVTGGSLTLDWLVSDAVTFTSITGYDDFDKVHFEDSDTGPQTWLDIDFPINSETFSQEYRLNGRTERTNWLVGVFYLDESLAQPQRADVFRDLRPLFGFDPDRFIFTSQHLHQQDTRAWAVFGQADIILNDKWQLTAGIRFSNEAREFSADVSFVEDFDPPLQFVDFNDKLTDENVSGKLVLTYRPTDTAMIYGSVSTGFKSGGFPGVFGLAPEDYTGYKAETLIAYEVGFKSDLADGRAKLNGSAFLYDYSDLQLFQLFTGAGIPVQRLTNAADAEVIGAELELIAQPVDGLSLLASFAYVDTKLKDFVPVPGVNLSGNELANAPGLSFNGLARYDWTLETAAGVYVQADVTYQDDMFFDAVNNPVIKEDAYTIWGARVGFISASDRWEIALWSKNLANEDYFTFGLDLSGDFGLYQMIAAAPRTYGLELIGRF